jgi:SpoVK/Ycf46/Vps4 family AAA+-type ATPase
MGKRRELDESRGCGQTENAIQNIILSEMEDLKGGILIATTNMTCNFDKAFERRFLYKIEFEKPGPEARAAIWKAILPGLPESQAKTLSLRYDLSGGQIENVARKQMVSSVLHGGPIRLKTVAAFCDEESQEKARKPIGFLA